MWHRVFARSDVVLSASDLVAHLHAAGLPVVPHFKGDDLGWTGGDLVLPGGGTAVHIDRYLTEINDLRKDLNSFAAELETMDYAKPHNVSLMERVIQTRQLFTYRKPIDHSDDAILEHLCETLAQFLATQLDGTYQIDTRGWFAADGTLVVQEY